MTALALTPARLLGQLYISFWVPVAALALALLIKLPTIVRLWRDPLLRAAGGTLLITCAVFVFCAPSMIVRVNRVTGVPNIAAPWCYSLITAMSGSCLLLIITWRNGPSGRSPVTRCALRRVVSVYAGVIVALWVLFALADVPVQRVHDLDTYYAGTPFMREEILLYLLAHAVACVVASGLIRNWVRTEGLDGWLRWGLRLLGAGYALSLGFIAAKLVAVAARWCGGDLDWLSTDLAPPLSATAALLVAGGFILPHAGQYLHERWHVRRTYRELRPLYDLLRTASGEAAPVPHAPLAGPELRLTRRETFIRDLLLPLTRHIDPDLNRRAHDAARTLGHGPERARALAGAVSVLAAIERRGELPEPTNRVERADRTDWAERTERVERVERAGQAPAADTHMDAADTYLDAAHIHMDSGTGTAPGNPLRDIGAISRALRRPADIEAVRARATEGVAARE
ncbi:MAB_1171c family putative transporter [Streptomyces sp. NPDC048297]|uniref:MAB_1171c family putative transporter n=1 Tax=Streptomyces sp. NPDC048297 TaxID=3365531 RepID=UPI00371331EB